MTNDRAMRVRELLAEACEADGLTLAAQSIRGGVPEAEIFVHYALRAIERALALSEREGGWQPIETAPKGQTVIIFIPVADQPANPPRGQEIVAYQTNNGEPFKETWRYANGPGSGQQCGWPTHWRPLHDPPTPGDPS